MRYILAFIVILLLVDLHSTLPVTKSQDEATKDEIIEKAKVNTDNHATFVEKHIDQVNSGDPHARTKWDEERRQKLELLRLYYNRERELETGIEMNPFKHHENGDPIKIHADEISEVKKSIAKVTEELAQIDHKRRELFKEYEMQKRFNEQQKEMGNGEMNEEKRKQYHEEQEKLKEKHKKHEPLHHPGSKQQLEEVWEKQDHIYQDFDPETFFNLHDFDGDGVWNQDEVKSLFQNELDKMYQEGMPEDDLFERREEMERMREHVFKEADTNKNGFIEFHEFLRQTQEPQFQKDEGWKGLDEEQIYTQEDYDNYLKYHQQQLAAQSNAQAAANNMASLQQQNNPHLQYQQGQVPQPTQYNNIQPQQYQNQPAMNVQYQQQQVPVYQQQQPLQYQQVPVQQQQYQVPVQQQQQQQHIPPQYIPRDQIPLEKQYQHQGASVVQQNIAQQSNIQVQQPPSIQPQPINNGHLNVQVPSVAQFTQNQQILSQTQQPLPSQNIVKGAV